MAKFIIPVEQLPPPNADGNQLFRFRIKSEDGNTYSEYSSLYIIESKGQIYPLQVSASASLQGNNVVVAWDTPSIYNYSSSATLYKNGAELSGISASVLHNHGTDWKVHDADIFVSWFINGSYQDWQYQGRSKDNNFFIQKVSNATKVKVYGQVATYPPTRNTTKFKIFETPEINL
jgi:hypothetical protein